MLPQKKKTGTHHALPAESGRPETAREFAKRIRRVVLHPPREQRQEGAGESQQALPEPKQIIPDPETEHREQTPVLNEEQTAQRPEGANTPGLEPRQTEQGSLLDHVASASDGIHLESAIKGRFKEDPFFEPILANPRQYKNFVVKDGLVYLRDCGRELICIPHVLVDGRNVREIVITHAHSLLAHLGAAKTVNLLRDHVWWKS
ncbi:hypothetical protein PYCCODRAFT_1370133, partial [Trametes coccinea BRFM310]